MNQIPIADKKDQKDAEIASWGRSRHDGFRKFNHGFLQPAPMFFTQDHHPLWLGDIYRGRSAFLIASGPSFAALDHSPLKQPGVLTMGLNNSARTFRPNLWCSVDNPDHWIRSVWFDPTIMKFAPISHAAKKIFNSDTWQFMDMRVGDCPNVVYYKRNEHFQAKQFLWEDCFNWGNHKDYGGGRSVMLPAVRILFLLGIRRVFLLGVDLDMKPDRTYHFDQKRHGGSVRGNNSTYGLLNKYFGELKPHFEAQDFHVFNCNPESKLTVFEHAPYKEALRLIAAENGNVDVSNERTRHLYDTEIREKEEGTAKELTWLRIDPPGKLRKCKFCGKRCARGEGDERKPGLIRLALGCEKARRKLWKHEGSRYVGDPESLRTPWGTPDEARSTWNKMFGRNEPESAPGKPETISLAE